MSSPNDRHDLRRQTREIQESLSRFDREQLVDILTHVFRVYVMEGAALSPPNLSSGGDELAGLSFAQLIERLQLRLDLPELKLFEAQGGRVSVRIDGRLTPLDGASAPTEPPARPAPAQAAPPAAAAAAAPAPRPPAPGVEVREVVLPNPPLAQSAAARSGGIRSTGQATSAGGVAARATSAAPATAPAAPAVAPPAPAPKAEPKPPEPPSAGGRFGLLEID